MSEERCWHNMPRVCPEVADGDDGLCSYHRCMQTTGYIYFIECDGFIKIGHSRALEQRIESIISSNPHEIILLDIVPGSIDKEKKLHTRFSSYRHRGEWFRKNDELLKYIKRVGVCAQNE